MKMLFLLSLLPSLALGVCDVPTALQTLMPGAQWTVKVTTFTNIQWLDTIQTQPTQSQINQAISDCQANQIQLASYQLELSTTSASLVGKTQGYVGANALAQIQINAKMARILELRVLLGLQ